MGEGLGEADGISVIVGLLVGAVEGIFDGAKVSPGLAHRFSFMSTITPSEHTPSSMSDSAGTPSQLPLVK